MRTNPNGSARAKPDPRHLLSTRDRWPLRGWGETYPARRLPGPSRAFTPTVPSGMYKLGTGMYIQSSFKSLRIRLVCCQSLSTFNSVTRFSPRRRFQYAWTAVTSNTQSHGRCTLLLQLLTKKLFLPFAKQLSDFFRVFIRFARADLILIFECGKFLSIKFCYPPQRGALLLQRAQRRIERSLDCFALLGKQTIRRKGMTGVTAISH